MIFRAHNKRTKSNRWPLYLKNWASYSNFRRSRYNNISLSQNFKISISQLVFEIGVWFFACDHNFYRLEITFSNMGYYGTPSFISEVVSNWPSPVFSSESETAPLTVLTKPKLKKWIYKIKSTKQNVWNVNNQIYQTKSIQWIYKKTKLIQSKIELSLTQLSPSLLLNIIILLDNEQRR